MKSISTIAIIAAAALFSNAIAAPSPEPSTIAYKTLTYKGCFSSGDGLTKNSTYTYNSKGYCQTQCVPIDYAVQATYNSDECWCGDDLPPAADLVDDSYCNSPCAGIDTEMCGGTKLYWSVYLTGTESSAPNYDPAAAASSSSAAYALTHTSTSTPSVVTVGGQTVTVQASAAAAASSSAAALTDKSSSGPSKAGIAAGVVVGVLLAAALAGGIFIMMRNKKRREVEEEYRRNAAVNNFVAGGKSPVSSGGASFNDTRLDPTLAHRRMSDGSIADNQDYSRRILKVTNA
ncbi:WSC domain [Ciborinia camelliae]|nr:WSC domain [Ciborinia camelliae]